MDVSDRFATVTRKALHASAPTATADRIIELAMRGVPGCDHAGLRLVQWREATVATSDDVAALAEQRQYDLDEGPGPESARQRMTIRTPRLDADRRWPVWGPWARAELGLKSALSFHLFINVHSYGVLSLYSSRRAAFTADDEGAGRLLSGHAASAIAASRTLETVTRGRGVVDEARGILMERFGVGPDLAFAVLERIACEENSTLRLVAENIVRIGDSWT